MKNKILLLIIGLILLSACSNNVTKKFNQTRKENSMDQIIDSDNKKKIIINDYQFHIPTAYSVELVSNSKAMEKELLDRKTLEISDQEVSFALYKGSYDVKNEMVILVLYLFNNSEKNITAIKFDTSIDFSNLGGKKDQGDFTFTKEHLDILGEKTITPIFIGFPNMKLSNIKDFYPSTDFETLKISNILVEYDKN